MVGAMDTLPPSCASVEPASWARWAAALIQHRQTILPKRLVEPGPTGQELDAIFEAASAAPDHGELLPWRFIVVPSAAREQLAQAFAEALLERDPAAAVAQIERAREKAFRAPARALAGE